MNFKDSLNEIYSSFKQNQSIGIDGISKEKYDLILEDELDIIERKILNESFEFSYYKESLIIKAMNKTRQISIPTLRDKLVLKYLHNKILEYSKIDLKQIPSLHTMI